MVRLLHTSDTHLGHQQYARTDPRSGLNQREQDHYDAWEALIDQAIADPPDVFVHAGDLFDGVRPSNRALAAAMDGLLRLSRAGIDTVLIAGNHETPKMRGTGSPFRLFAHLPHIHPVYRGRAETLHLAGATVHAVPQCADHETLRSQVAALERGPGHNVLVIHGAVATIEAFRHAEFNEQTLDAAWFDHRFDYVALGHYHGTTEVAPRIWYCGAPDRVSMGEAGEAKGYLRVEVSAAGANPAAPESARAPSATPSIQAAPATASVGAARTGTTPGRLANAAAPAIDFIVLPVRAYADLPPIHAAELDAAAIHAAASQAIARIPAGAVARVTLRDVNAALRGGLDQRALRAAAGHAMHLDLRIDWADRQHHVDGGVELGPLEAEFSTFVRQQPLEGVDRQRIEQMATVLLRDAQEGS